jgi:hypothetical protein
MNPQGDISTLLTMGTFLLWLDTGGLLDPLKRLNFKASFERPKLVLPLGFPSFEE